MGTKHEKSESHEPTIQVEATEEKPQAPAESAKVGIFKALLGAPIFPETQIMRTRQAAFLAIYASEQPDLMAEAMTPDEVRTWASRFRTTNPHAWHASMVGDVLRFAAVVGLRPADVAKHYQTTTSELISAASRAA